MRNILLLFLFSCFFCKAQNIDLVELINGEMESFTKISDYHTDAIIGYFILSKLEKTSADYNKYEYTFLDKNLNKVLNKEFEAESGVSHYKISVNKNNDVVLKPKLNFNRYKKKLILSKKNINLKTNEITSYKDMLCFHDNSFFTCPVTYKDGDDLFKGNNKKIGYTQFNDQLETLDGLTVINQYAWFAKHSNKNTLICFDKDKVELWRYPYNNFDKKKSVRLDFLESDDEFLYFFKTINLKKEKFFSILIINKLNGNASEKIIEKQDHNYNLSNSNGGKGDIASFYYKSLKNKIIIINRLLDKKGKYIGFYRLMLDKITKKVDLQKLTFEDDFKKYIPEINFNGYLKNKYYLSIRDIILSKNGEAKFIFEKHKQGGTYSVSKTKDLVYLSTDSNFNIDKYLNIEKEKSRNNDSEYLFSQVSQSGRISFYYFDFLKETKQLNLYINFIENGEFKQDIIEMKSENNDVNIYPYYAKDGYILLREFNKKEKYNQIRLERLNY